MNSLAEVKRLIEIHGWTKYHVGNYDTGFCVSGAIMRVAEQTFPHENRVKFHFEKKLGDEFSARFYKTRFFVQSVVTINDAFIKDKQELLEILSMEDVNE